MKLYELTGEKLEEYNKWLKSRPRTIQKLCQKCPPDRLYRIRDTGERCYIVAYSEDRTIRVAITGKYNYTMIDKTVFGLLPEDLEECDGPEPDEKIGTVFTEQKDIDNYIDLLKKIHEHDKKKTIRNNKKG